MEKGDFFKDVVQLEFAVPEFNWIGKLPCFYYDTTTMTAVYTASTKKVRPYLPLPEMHPVEMIPGRCLVAFTAFEYRDTDIDPYNEFSITVLITFRRRSIPGLTMMVSTLNRCMTAYVWHLPVTTEIARRGGVDHYGYPKFIADIAFERTPGKLTCTLTEGSETILTLTGNTLPTRPEKRTRIRTYSVKNGIPLATNIDVNPMEYAQSKKRNAATLEIGSNHAICRELHEIGLSARPILYQYIPLNEAILFPPRNLMDD
jgi:hypothetical protein